MYAPCNNSASRFPRIWRKWSNEEFNWEPTAVPGTRKEANRLPAPKSGGFAMNLRLFWLKTVLDGSWTHAAKRIAPADSNTRDFNSR